MKNSAVRFVLLASCLLLPAAASASPSFPGVMREALGLSYDPPCSHCHFGGRMGFGTVTTPFGTSLRQLGLTAGDPESLKKALAQLETEKIDSAGGGMSDIEKLKQGMDPNSAPHAAVVSPQFGCHVGGTSRGAFAGLATAAVLGAMMWQRRRRR